MTIDIKYQRTFQIKQRAAVAMLLMVSLLYASQLPAQVTEPASQPNVDRPDEPADSSKPVLRFSFNGAPWRQVIDWLSEESRMALHVGDLPSGSFTYSDPGQFSVDEAIARVNLFLIPQGYSVVRRENLLSVINLGDPRSIQQLDAMAPLTSVSDLEALSDHQVVKCMIALGELDSEDAIAEIKPLSMMTTPVVLPTSKQLMITDTVTRMRSAIAVLEAMRAGQRQPSVVKRFDLEHTDIETVMLVVGTHLDLDSDQMAGMDISISTDLAGKRLFVTGSPEKVEKLEQLLTVIDVQSELDEEPQDRILQSHVVSGGNLEGVYDVLQTILAGQSIRLSMEPKTSSIVALADAGIHEKIEATIEELRAAAVEFAVVDLNTIDPFFAITLIGEMFGITSSYDDENVDETQTAFPPKVDADPDNRRLFVRGTKEQIAQVEQLVRGLDSSPAATDDVRVIPLRGRDGQQVLEIAAESWNGRGKLNVLPPSERIDIGIVEKAINPNQQPNIPSSDIDSDDDESVEIQIKTTASKLPDYQALVGLNHREPENETAASFESIQTSIQTRMTPDGIEIRSRDPSVLGAFERHIRTVAAKDQNAISPPTAYYLKYVSADEAVQMLADLLDGENSLASSPSGSLVNGGSISSRGNGYYGSLLFKRDGATTMTTGTATIVSDARLNRLIVQGTIKDIEMVERYLELIDKSDSIIDVEKAGQTHVVQLINTKAEEVAEVIRQAFLGRIAKDESNTQDQQRRGDERGRGGDGRGGGEQGDEGRPQRPVDKPTRGREPEMTLAVHAQSNTLIITAPDQLFAEVKKLIESVDTRSEQMIEVIPAGDGVDLESILKGMMGQPVDSRSRSRNDSRREDDRRSRSRG